MLRKTLLLAAAAGAAHASPLAATVCPAQAGDYAAVDNAQLPDPWTFANGKPVVTTDDWACRQQEMSQLLQQFELGALPPAPDSVTATMSGGSMSLSIKVGSNTKTVSVSLSKGSSGAAIIAVGGSSIPIPSSVGKINFGNDACAAQANPASHGTGWFFDLHGKTHPAGALTAWAWCVGRIIDGLEQLGADKTGIDPKKLGVTGCSRNGKGAFLVGTLEPRIALTLPQESGSGGAAPWRVSDSEKTKGKSIQTAHQIIRENAWFSHNFDPYVNKTNELPEDHHFLPALIAPRGLFIMENDIDWLGPVSTTVAMKAGRMIYDALGVRSNMGFALVGGHSHCSFPSSSTSDLNSYINKFLLGTGKTSDAEISPANVTMSDWISKWSATPKLAPAASS